MLLSDADKRTPFDTAARAENAAPAVALTIAGFDPSSGAGVTADLQVFQAFGLFGTACVTALTAQSTLGVHAVASVSGFIGQTLEELERDLPCVGVKIGMLGDREAVEAVAAFLQGRRGVGPVVLDPVLRASSGAELLSADGLAALRAELLPLVDWVTPNLAELEALGGMEALGGLHVAATGGDLDVPVDVLRMRDGTVHRFAGEHIATRSTHGTGCAFSSALLSRLVLGDSAVAAVGAAKAYVAEAMRRAPGIGGGRGPLDLLWPLRGKRDAEGAG